MVSSGIFGNRFWWRPRQSAGVQAHTQFIIFTVVWTAAMWKSQSGNWFPPPGHQAPLPATKHKSPWWVLVECHRNESHCQSSKSWGADLYWGLFLNEKLKLQVMSPLVCKNDSDAHFFFVICSLRWNLHKYPLTLLSQCFKYRCTQGTFCWQR